MERWEAVHEIATVRARRKDVLGDFLGHQQPDMGRRYGRMAALFLCFRPITYGPSPGRRAWNLSRDGSCQVLICLIALV